MLGLLIIVFDYSSNLQLVCFLNKPLQVIFALLVITLTRVLCIQTLNALYRPVACW